jgi:hypothetical protein
MGLAATCSACGEPIQMAELFNVEVPLPTCASPARVWIPLSACSRVAHFGREHVVHLSRVLTPQAYRPNAPG